MILVSALGENTDGPTQPPLKPSLPGRAAIASNFTEQTATDTTSAAIQYLQYLITSVLSDALSRSAATPAVTPLVQSMSGRCFTKMHPLTHTTS
jgi:hypothetical protein